MPPGFAALWGDVRSAFDHGFGLSARSAPVLGCYRALAAGRTTISLRSTSAGWVMAKAMVSAIAAAGMATECPTRPRGGRALDDPDGGRGARC
ncbi:hypothetical protein GCM10023222_43560 [Saccharopolyspora cebuensis]